MLVVPHGVSVVAHKRRHCVTVEWWNDMQSFHAQLGLGNEVHDCVRDLASAWRVLQIKSKTAVARLGGSRSASG
jgi:hypothetical protein